jgi:hypothetical protein
MTLVEKEGSGAPSGSSTRLIVLLGILGSVICLSYFILIDRFIFSSSYFTPIFRVLLTVYDSQTAWLSLVVCLMAALWNGPATVTKCIDYVVANRFLVIASMVALLAIGSVFIYHGCAFSMDEYAAVFQSKIFARGQLYGHLPPSVMRWLIVPGFNGSFLFASRETGKVIEGYWPGFALLLAPFQFLGVSWLCNALLAGLALYLIFLITAEITGDLRCAGWAMFFCIASGAFVSNAISYYSMQAHLTANLLFAWLLLKATPPRALMAGLVGSVAIILHNPMPHAVFALPWVLSLAMNRSQRAYLVPLILGYLPGLGLALAWLILRADIVPVTDNIQSVIGSGVFVLPDEGLLQMRSAALAKMWLWAVPCLFIFAIVGWARHRNDAGVRLLACSAALTFVSYLFVRLDQGHGWGYRYFHSAWGTIPILAGCAMSGKLNPRLVSFAGALTILNLLIIVPFQMHQIDGIISRHQAQLPPPRRPGNNVYFIPGGGGFYMVDMVQIDPMLRDTDLLMLSRGKKLDTELMRQNWPDAVVVNHGYWAQQWYLGPDDKRQVTENDRVKHFVLEFNTVAKIDRPKEFAAHTGGP